MNNIGNNRVSANLQPDDFNAIKQAIQEIRNRMPFLLGLTLEERKKLAKINRSNKLFVSDAIEVVRENPEALSYYLTVHEKAIQKNILPIRKSCFLKEAIFLRWLSAGNGFG